MERREEAEGRLSEARAAFESSSAARGEIEARKNAAVEEIDASRQQREDERKTIASDIPIDLLGLYEKVRTQQGGAGAAALRQRRCEGCRIEFSGNELSAIRQAADDDVVRCENCRRILVRTPESGL
jgi:predicted  nucleic acid-binding Zn-ribbon protein